MLGHVKISGVNYKQKPKLVLLLASSFDPRAQQLQGKTRIGAQSIILWSLQFPRCLHFSGTRKECKHY